MRLLGPSYQAEDFDNLLSLYERPLLAAANDLRSRIKNVQARRRAVQAKAKGHRARFLAGVRAVLMGRFKAP